MKIRFLIIACIAGILIFLLPHEACADRFGFSKFSLFFWQNQNSFTLQSRLVQRMKVRELTRESRELRRKAELFTENIRRNLTSTMAQRSDLITLERASQDKIREGRRMSRETARANKMQRLNIRDQARDLRGKSRRLAQQRKDFIRNLENLRR